MHDVARGIGLDGRIGRKFLHAGPGYGGSCFPKDTIALVRTAEDYGSPMRIIAAVVDINVKRKRAWPNASSKRAATDLVGKTVGILGVTFKPNTDDMRDAPALDIIPALQAAGARVRAYDPAGMHEAAKLLPGVEWVDDAYKAVEGADVAAILTEWNEFRALQLPRVAELMNQPVLVDLRNVYNLADMAQAGFEYHSIGRPAVLPEPRLAASNGKVVELKARA